MMLTLHHSHLLILHITHHLYHHSDFHLPGILESLRLSLAKLSRYISACVDLIRAATRHSIFANLTVEIFKFEPAAPVRYSPPQETLFESLIERLSLNTTPERLLSCLKFQGAAGEDKCSSAALTLCELINADCPVHAEVQLLFCYEFHTPQGLVPRVICSTKSACYLCNLFFSIHGRFYIPSTHGRVYEKWTLPKRVQEVRNSQLNDVIAKFSHELIEVVRQLVAQPYRKTYHPNESAYFF
jgi:hypothetical protein